MTLHSLASATPGKTKESKAQVPAFSLNTQASDFPHMATTVQSSNHLRRGRKRRASVSCHLVTFHLIG
jgi:hypothetical protein